MVEDQLSNLLDLNMFLNQNLIFVYLKLVPLQLSFSVIDINQFVFDFVHFLQKFPVCDDLVLLRILLGIFWPASIRAIPLPIIQHHYDCPSNYVVRMLRFRKKKTKKKESRFQI